MNSAIKKINPVLKNAIQHWSHIASLLIFPKTEKEYNLLVDCLDQLLDIVGEDENHQLMGLVDILSNLISIYDEKHFPTPKIKAIDTLKYLMELHELNQADLREIGSQGVVSEILNGKRKLNLRQIVILAKLFNVNPATFIDN